MSKNKTRKALLERYKQFEGMTDQEIHNHVPQMKVDLFKDKYGVIRPKIKECSICGKEHLHGGYFMSGNEYRTIHCKNLLEGMTYPEQYALILDWDHGENENYRDSFNRMRLLWIMNNLGVVQFEIKVKL